MFLGNYFIIMDHELHKKNFSKLKPWFSTGTVQDGKFQFTSQIDVSCWASWVWASHGDFRDAEHCSLPKGGEHDCFFKQFLFFAPVSSSALPALTGLFK